MSIDRNILWKKLEAFIDSQYKTDSGNSVEFEKYLAKAIIFNDKPTSFLICCQKDY